MPCCWTNLTLWASTVLLWSRGVQSIVLQGRYLHSPLKNQPVSFFSPVRQSPTKACFLRNESKANELDPCCSVCMSFDLKLRSWSMQELFFGRADMFGGVRVRSIFINDQLLCSKLPPRSCTSHRGSPPGSTPPVLQSWADEMPELLCSMLKEKSSSHSGHQPSSVEALGLRFWRLYTVWPSSIVTLSISVYGPEGRLGQASTRRTTWNLQNTSNTRFRPDKQKSLNIGVSFLNSTSRTS